MTVVICSRVYLIRVLLPALATRYMASVRYLIYNFPAEDRQDITTVGAALAANCSQARTAVRG